MEVACPGLSQEQPSAGPLGRVGLGMLPEEFQEPIVALVTEPDDEIGIFTFVELLEDGSASLFTPFHPGVSIDGGPVQVLITDGVVACPPLDFTIEAMPPAPGESGRLVDMLQELIGINAADVGLTPQDLLAPDAELPDHAIPLAVAQILLDDPENPDSLRAFSESTAPFLEGASDNTFLDALLARTGLVQVLAGDAAGRPTLPLAAPQGAIPTCNDSAAALDFCMGLAKAAEQRLNPPEKGPALKKLKEDVALTITVLKLFPATRKLVAIPGKIADEVKKLFPMIDTAIMVRKWMDEGAAALLPSSLTDLEFNLFPSVMGEDEPDGEWGLSALIATSKGWKLDAKRILEYAFTQLNAKGILQEQVQKGVGKLGELAGKLPKGLNKKALEKKLTDLIVKNVLKIAPDAFKGVTLFEIEPMSFGPVDIDDEAWSTSDILGAALAKLDHNKFEGIRVGTAKIIVRPRTDGGKFGGAASFSVARTVEVKKMVVKLTPDEVVLKPGDETVFTVTVENSFFPDQIEAEAAGQTSINLGAGGTHTIDYTAPEIGKLPDTLVVHHTACTGARRFDNSARSDSSLIRAKPVVIVLPEKSCVDPGESTNMIALVQGVEDQRVIWEPPERVFGSGQPGTISDSGRFTEPDSPGLIQITATSVVDETAKGGEVVKVGGCDCWWSVSIEGRTIFGIAGQDKGGFTLQGGHLTISLDRLTGGALLAPVGRTSPCDSGRLPLRDVRQHRSHPTRFRVSHPRRTCSDYGRSERVHFHPAGRQHQRPDRDLHLQPW